MGQMTRRTFLKAGMVGGAVVLLPATAMSGCGSQRSREDSERRSSAGRVEPFTLPLALPPVLKPVSTEGGMDRYELTQREGRVEILPGLKTTVWGYDGVFPGPTIEARSGRTVIVRQRNELPVPVSTHLHGGVTPPESDGYPTDLILPPGTGENEHHAAHGGTTSAGFKDYVYPNEQPAATLWYHDHRMDFTGPQVYRGLAGLYTLRDGIEDALPLPAGDREVQLVICDRIFSEDGSLYYPSRDPSLTGEPGVEEDYMDGVEGSTILVNGVPWPFLEVSNTRYRLRILNASNARQYELALDPAPPDGAAFVQVGSDVGLLETPVPHDTIRIAPAERFDVVVDFGRYAVGTKVTLRNRAGDGPAGEVMRFDIVRQGREESTVPARLAPTEDVPDEGEAVATRQFRFTPSPRPFSTPHFMWTINGEPFDAERIDARPRLGTTEIWEFSSVGNHPIHVHLAHFRVLSRGDRGPGPYDAGWKDTVSVPTGSPVRVLARFDGYRGKYVMHCHNLEHEDMMMMANFEVT
jgi:spore coat protein A